MYYKIKLFIYIKLTTDRFSECCDLLMTYMNIIFWLFLPLKLVLNIFFRLIKYQVLSIRKKD